MFLFMLMIIIIIIVLMNGGVGKWILVVANQELNNESRIRCANAKGNKDMNMRSIMFQGELPHPRDDNE